MRPSPVPDSPTPEALETLLRLARAERASDLHWQPRADGYRLLLRRDGEIAEHSRVSHAEAARMLAQLKILARLPVYRRDVPQEGRIALPDTGHGRLLARATFLPTIHGEKAVVRLFIAADPALSELEHLGLPDEVVAALLQWIEKKQGMILLTGPSGSGKTTTIYALLQRLHRLHAHNLNLTTLEDPVECDLGFATQTQIEPDQGLGFAEGLRTLLRQDPDVIAVGEIRDRETAEIAVRAALTGHLVVSTLHAGSTVEVPIRLLEMGVEPFLIASTLLGVVSQRLFRVACGECRGAGCPACDGRGWSGRRALGECLVPDRAFTDLLLSHPHTEQLREAAAGQLRITLAADARRRLAAGEISPAEIARVLGGNPS